MESKEYQRIVKEHQKEEQRILDEINLAKDEQRKKALQLERE